MVEVKRDSGPPSGVCLADSVVRRRLSELSLLTPEFRLQWRELRDRMIAEDAPPGEALDAALALISDYVDAQFRGPLVRGYYAIGVALGVSEAQAYAMRDELPIVVDHRRSPTALESDLAAWVERRIAPAGAPRRIRSQPPSSGTRWTGKRVAK